YQTPERQVTTMIDKNILRYIPKKYHHLIASLTVEKNAEFTKRNCLGNRKGSRRRITALH
ncbi:MAG: hypothetical protein K2M91_03245, partial [Lachnospiraceae bacterium]|nr:hypothetical protein [Lachnospiraceae bacterium]